MLAYLRLLRLPTVFTAMADIVLGFLLVHRSLEPWPKFLGLLGASCGLYLAGMVFNDVFDRKQDAIERPNRPIPSGQVSFAAAVLLGMALMAAGVGAAATVGQPSVLVALLLVAAILGYDAALKRTLLGPLAMGTCRSLNLLLGASDQAAWASVWQPPQWVVALGLGVYIVGVTWFARTEAKLSSRGQLRGALSVLLMGHAILAGLFLAWPGEGARYVALAMLAGIAAMLVRRANVAIADPVPARVQGMIKLFLLNYVMTAAAVVYWHTGNGPLFFGTACLVVPPMIISRVIPMT